MDKEERELEIADYQANQLEETKDQIIKLLTNLTDIEAMCLLYDELGKVLEKIEGRDNEGNI